MMYKTKKRPLKINLSGGIAEDFYTARRAKTAKLRRIIRACFYLHCLIALVCILLSIILQAGFDIVKVTVCSLTSVVFAFFAVGELEHVKTISCVIDFAFAAGAFITALLGQHRGLFITCGILMCVLGISTIISGIAAARKQALNSAPPPAGQRAGFTRQDLPDYDDIPDLPEDYIFPEIPSISDTANITDPTETPEVPQVPPQPAGKMRELANQVCEIICGESKENRR